MPGLTVRRRFGLWLKPALDASAGAMAVLLLKCIRRMDPDRIADRAGAIFRRVGPWLPEHRTGRANLAASYPDKSPAEIEAILRGVWDNLGRVVAEYAHLDRFAHYDQECPERGRVQTDAENIARFLQLRDDGRPALIFAAHTGNWELPAVVAANYGLEAAILYRPPSIGSIADAINRIRRVNMGTLVPASPEAALRLAAALERKAHVGMLVDQHFSRGVDVTFFGRTCKANPMIARLAAHFDCPIHGVRTIRLPGHRFRFELTPAIEPARSADGSVDIAATMQRITSVVESWVREHPEQWLWLHRRWR